MMENEMSICYSDTGEKFKGSISALDPIICFQTHFKNYMYLTFIFENSDDWREKRQANKEILIAEKKMEFWKKRMPDFKEIEIFMKSERRRWGK